MNYAHTVTVALSYEEAVQQTRESLAEQGFGVLSEIDVRATFEAKLGVESAQALACAHSLTVCDVKNFVMSIGWAGGNSTSAGSMTTSTGFAASAQHWHWPNR